ncbi:hypothetical protein [Candidatus Nardonella dryophthoridicola]|uniref:hypothetical protein n=1 Tax=Candidatus Nardonella dryophthoridicola TaxID=1971485 RepID=UPI001AD88297|nr:hypothetical protein [Candidatus Nardonella dryophthoridicola]QTJ62929.1 hypothetical protein JRY34_00255 [Candidatus Nardonella dryophthoridicola]
MNDIISTINIDDDKIIITISNKKYNNINILSLGIKKHNNIFNKNIINNNIIFKKINESILQSSILYKYNFENIYLMISNLNIKLYNMFIDENIDNKIIDNNLLINIIKNNIYYINIIKYNFILHILPSSYIIDNICISNPIGLYGKKIKISLIFIYCNKIYVKNILKFINKKIRYNIKKIIYIGLSSFYSLISKKDILDNFIFIDIKLYNTHVFIYYKGFIKNIKILEIGEEYIYNYISLFFNLNFTKSKFLVNKIIKNYIYNNKEKNIYINIYNKKLNLYKFFLLIKKKYIELLYSINNKINNKNKINKNNNIIINNIIINSNLIKIKSIFNDIKKKFKNKNIKINLLDYNNIIGLKNILEKEKLYSIIGLLKYINNLY